MSEVQNFHQYLRTDLGNDIDQLKLKSHSFGIIRDCARHFNNELNSPIQYLHLLFFLLVLLLLLLLLLLVFTTIVVTIIVTVFKYYYGGVSNFTNSSTYGRRSSQIPHFYISEAYERTLAGSDAQRCSAGNGRNWEAGPTHSMAKMKTWWFKQLNCINIYKKL